MADLVELIKRFEASQALAQKTIDEVKAIAEKQGLELADIKTELGAAKAEVAELKTELAAQLESVGGRVQSACTDLKKDLGARIDSLETKIEESLATKKSGRGG